MILFVLLLEKLKHVSNHILKNKKLMDLKLLELYMVQDMKKKKKKNYLIY